jgi:hypothetical protein
MNRRRMIFLIFPFRGLREKKPPGKPGDHLYGWVSKYGK